MAPILSRLCSLNWNIVTHKKIINHYPLVRWLKRDRANNKQNFKLTPEHQISEESVNFKHLFKPFLFTVTFSGSTFALATIWQYENIRKYTSTHIKRFSNWWENEPIYKRITIRKQINEWWNNKTQGQKIALGIIAINTFVFLMWRIPSLQPTMLRYFCSNPAAKAVCWPMLLSTFSHSSGLHLAANMFVLYSFSSGAGEMFGKEQFLATYLSAGVISSFISHMYKVTTGRIGLSLGASGAIMAIMAAFCLRYPNTELAIIFFPFATFSAGMAIKCVIAMDMTGVLLGWKFFDHAAHLGGSLFGIMYLYYGEQYIWQQRQYLLEVWHNWRSRIK